MQREHRQVLLCKLHRRVNNEVRMKWRMPMNKLVHSHKHHSFHIHHKHHMHLVHNTDWIRMARSIDWSHNADLVHNNDQRHLRSKRPNDLHDFFFIKFWKIIFFFEFWDYDEHLRETHKQSGEFVSVNMSDSQPEMSIHRIYSTLDERDRQLVVKLQVHHTQILDYMGLGGQLHCKWLRELQSRKSTRTSSRNKRTHNKKLIPIHFVWLINQNG